MMARTAPPAMTPVPVAAGFSSTEPAPCSPRISCGIVDPVRGISTCCARRLDRLADRFRDFVRLARREADPALAVAHRHQGVEGEPPAALHDLGDAIDVHHLLDEAPPSPRRRRPLPPRAALAAAAAAAAHRRAATRTAAPAA